MTGRQKKMRDLSLKITLVIFVLLNEYSGAQGLPKQCQYSGTIANCMKMNLTWIPSDVFSSNYTQIKLAENPFACNCNMAWFLDAIHANQNSIKRIIDLDSLKCGSPKDLYSRLIRNLTEEDVCLSPVTTSTPTPTQPDACLESKLVNTCDPVREICVKKGDSYECRCKDGFRKTAGATECEVVNACQQNNTCSEHAQCINEIGSYKCICNLGYTGNGKNCEDKDECADKSHDCHKDAVCVNEVGSYKCHCKSGYEERKQGRLCVKKDSIATKTYILAGIIMGCPTIIFVCLTVFICRRRRRRKRLAAGARVLDDTYDIGQHQVPPDNQQLLSMDSYFEDSVPMKGMPTTESTWSEWPDYDDAKDSEVDSDF